MLGISVRSRVRRCDQLRIATGGFSGFIDWCVEEVELVAGFGFILVLFVSTPPNLLASGDEFSSPCRGVSSLCREFDIKLAFLEVRSGEGVLGEWEVVKRGRLAAKNKLG